MAVYIAPHPRRWLKIGRTSHAVYEREGDTCFLMCGQLVRGEKIYRAIPAHAKSPCEKCMESLKEKAGRPNGRADGLEC